MDDALSEPTLSVSAACIQNNCEIEMEDPMDKETRGQRGLASVNGITDGLGITEDAETLNGRFAM